MNFVLWKILIELLAPATRENSEINKRKLKLILTLEQPKKRRDQLKKRRAQHTPTIVLLEEKRAQYKESLAQEQLKLNSKKGKTQAKLLDELLECDE